MSNEINERPKMLESLKTMMKNHDLMVLSFAILVSMLGFGLIMPFLPVYAEEFGATDFEIGLMMGLFAIVRMFSSPIGGWLSDRVGRKPLMVFGMIFYCVVMFMFGIAGSLPELFLYRGLQGAASGLVWPVAMAYVGDIVEEEDRGKAMAIYSLMFASGMAVGPVLGGIISTAYSFSAAFFFTSALALLSGILILWRVRESYDTTKVEAPEQKGGWERFRLRNISPEPGLFLAISMASFCVFFGIAMIYPILPIYAADRLGLVEWEIGVLFTIMGLVQVVVMFPAGVLADNKGKKNVLLMGALLASLFGGSIALAWGFLSLIVLVAVYTLGRSMARPVFPAMISSLSSIQNRGKAMGIYTFAQNTAFALGSVASGYISMEVGRRWPFIFAMGMGMVGFLIILLGVRKGE